MPSLQSKSIGKFTESLEKAKEAGKKERALCKYREKHQMQDQISLDLTYAVLFNLANQYHANKMYNEAQDRYCTTPRFKLRFINRYREKEGSMDLYLLLFVK